MVAEPGRIVEFEAHPHREKKAFFAFRLQPDSQTQARAADESSGAYTCTVDRGLSGKQRSGGYAPFLSLSLK